MDKKVYYIDVDNTICTPVENGDYASAEPHLDRIEEYNKFYEDGNTVIYWTARGATTGIDWTELTEKQFKEWGVKCHEVKLGKPHYDVWIDDKSVNPNE